MVSEDEKVTVSLKRTAQSPVCRERLETIPVYEFGPVDSLMLQALVEANVRETDDA
jgi:hypothetical protein